MYIVFNNTATTEIYTLSLHDALPIFAEDLGQVVHHDPPVGDLVAEAGWLLGHGHAHIRPSSGPLAWHRCRASLSLAGLSRLSDRKSTRLKSSHANILYAVFCL